MNYKKYINIFLITAALSALLYFNCINNKFVFDDLYLVRDNPLISSIKIMPKVIVDNLRNFKMPYRVIRVISYQVDFLLSGRNTTAYHISNIIYHLLTSFLIFILTLDLTNKRGLSLLVSLIFLSHPVQTDTVTYISGRRDVLSGLFYFLGFSMFIKYRIHLRIIYLFIAIVSYLFGVFTKEMAVTLPIMFFLYDLSIEYKNGIVKPGKISSLRLFYNNIISTFWDKRALYIPIALFSVVYLVKYIYKYAVAGINYYGGSALFNFSTVIKIWFFYLKKLAFPQLLLADYKDSFPIVSDLYDFELWICILILFLLSLYMLKKDRFSSPISFGIAWFFISLLPVSHIIPYHELMAEHFLYIPSYGIILVFSYAVYSLRQIKGFKILRLPVFILLVSLFSVNTINRNYDWQDEYSLWSDTVRKSPASSRGYNNLGLALSEKGLFSKARNYYIRAIQLNYLNIEAYNNLAALYSKMGFRGKSILILNALLTVKPDFSIARNNLGTLYLNSGDTDSAIAEFNKVIMTKNILHDTALFKLGEAYYKKGLKQKSVFYFKKAASQRYDYFEAYNNLGIALASMGLFDKAIYNFKIALRYNPAYERARSNLNRALRYKQSISRRK